MPRDTEGNTFYLNNYIDQDQFNQLYNSKWQTKRTQSANAIVQKLMPVLKKAMKQRQKVGKRVAQMKKVPRKIDGDLSDQHKYNNYNIDESQNS